AVTRQGKIKKMTTLLDAGVFPGIQGGPLEHIIAAKAIAFGEAMGDAYLAYIQQVQKNARQLARAFMAKGYTVMSGGTDNHLVLIDLRSKGLTGKAAETALGQAAITVNKNMVPFDTQSPAIASGIRLGTAAMTTRGMQEKDMEKIVDLIDTVLAKPTHAATLSHVKETLRHWMQNFPMPG
ncbi:MAG: serine hydroxymethyltransferase, partial [Bacteroidota bacterium]